MTTMHVLYAGCFALFLLLFWQIYNARALFGTGRPVRLPWLYALLAIGSALLQMYFMHIGRHISTTYVVLLICMVGAFGALNTEYLYVNYLNAITLSLALVSLRALVTSLLSLGMSVSMSTIMQTTSHRMQTMLAALVIMNLYFLFFPISAKSAGLWAQFFAQKGLVRSMSTVGTIMFFYQAFCAEAFYYNLNFFWFIFLHLLGTVLILVGYFTVLRHTVASVAWLHEAWRLQTLEQLLQKQLSHYRAFSQYTSSIRRFKHDYNKIISVVRSLLYAGQGEKALAVLEDMDHLIQDDIMVHHPFSNNMLVDAAMQELANECLEKDIAFDANIYVPASLALSQMDMSCFFLGLCTQLMMRCQTAAAGNAPRHITVTGEGVEAWFIVSGEASFDSPFLDETDDAIDIEVNPASSSLAFLRKIAKKYGGFVQIESSESKKIFRLKAYLSASMPRSCD